MIRWLGIRWLKIRWLGIRRRRIRWLLSRRPLIRRPLTLEQVWLRYSGFAIRYFEFANCELFLFPKRFRSPGVVLQLPVRQLQRYFEPSSNLCARLLKY